MKAKIMKTGEIVDVYHEPQHGQASNIYKESVFVNGRMWQENELEFIESKDVDLEKEIGFFTTKELLKKRNFSTSVFHLTQSDIDNIAKHFFELGLKAKKGE